MRKNCLILLLIPSGVFVIILAAGVIYESIAANNAFRQHPPPGQLIDVGGYQLHLHVMGEDRGLPTVVLDHGAGSMSAQWGWIMPEIAQHTRVVAYDRPGMAWSDPSPRQLEADELVRDLHNALQQAGISGPYILVGHSMGGLITRLFAQAHPDEIAGLVQVDPRDIEWHGPTTGEMQIQLSVIKLVSRLGIPRLTGLAERDAQGLPSTQFEQAAAITPSYRHLRNISHEAYLGDSAAALLSLGEELDRFPMIILTASEPDEAVPSPMRDTMNEQHAHLAEIAAYGEQRIVQGANHLSITTQAEHAGLVTTAVLDLLSPSQD
jgi:pimeloyl-ACP methyl ester carboxylesterase